MQALRPTLILAAEPASIIYMVTGAVGLLLARFRSSGQPASSIVMLFCRRSSREKIGQISLI